MDCNGRSLVPAGGSEVNMLPEMIKGHTKIYICILTILYWLLVMSGGGCKQPCLCGSCWQVTVPCWAGLGLQVGARHTSLVCDLLGRLDMDLCSLHSWCPEAEGAFHLGVAGLYPFLGALEKQLPHVLGRRGVCIWVKAVLAGTSQRNTLQSS